VAGRLHRVRQRLERQELRHEAGDALVAAQLRVRQARRPQRAAHLRARPSWTSGVCRSLATRPTSSECPCKGPQGTSEGAEEEAEPVPWAGLRLGCPALACMQAHACRAGDPALTTHCAPPARLRRGRGAARERRTSLRTPASFAGAR